MKSWSGSAPSNIAIVKYMGKESRENAATNPSLSMTLEDFRTSVEISLIDEPADRWEPLGEWSLSEKGKARFLGFFGRLKAKESIQKNFLIRSGNNFPADAGLASSASSFAALTLTAYKAFSDLTGKPLPSAGELAQISRTGSGSSCRSFFSPWCLWSGAEICEAPANFPRLVDFVAILNHGTKQVSSSEAHERVRTSPLFDRRPDRAKARTEKALRALSEGDYAALAKIAWDDMWDMHSLFHTSDPSFTYMEPDTVAVLKYVENLWREKKHGPITTIDAGPNVHMLVPESEREEFLKKFRERFPKIQLLESR